VWALSENDPIITAYADAVAAMQAKPASDPTSWAYQANIHGTVLSGSPLWNQCQHGSWYFAPWHRMYLYYFERIVRAQVIANGGPSTWALPYWNYGGGNPDTVLLPYNSLPLAFRNPTRANGTPNPLYVADRGAGINAGAGLSSAVTSSAVAMACASYTGTTELGGGATSAGQFEGQYGQLESQPHNVVHSAMGGLMGDPLTAAEDPIFWLHHANIDRLWWVWQQTHPGDPSTPRWTGQRFSFFDVGGAPVSLCDADVVNIVSQLDYTYATYLWPIPLPWHFPLRWPWPWLVEQPASRVPQGPVPQPPPELTRHLIGGTDEPVRLVGETVTVPVTIDPRAAEALRAGPGAGEYQNRAFLDLENIEAERNPGTVYGVYVNLPQQPTAEDLASHQVGVGSFFGVERARDPRGDEHAHGLRYSMEMTGVLDKLAAEGSWQDGTKLDVTFRPIPLEPPADRPEMADDLVAATKHADVPATIGQVGVYFA
jgi:tyrosinase